jgi:hypothetical protein
MSHDEVSVTVDRARENAASLAFWASSDGSFPQPLTLCRAVGQSSSDDAPRFEELVEDVQAQVRSYAAAAIRDLRLAVVSLLMAQVAQARHPFDEQIQVLKRLVADLKLPRRVRPDEQVFENALKQAWLPVAESTVLALLDGLVSAPAQRLTARAWAKRTVEGIDTARFRKVTGLDDAGVNQALEVAAESLLGPSGKPPMFPSYYRDRWGDVTVEDGTVTHRPSVPVVLVRDTNGRSPDITAFDEGAVHGIIEVVPVGSLCVVSDDETEFTLSLPSDPPNARLRFDTTSPDAAGINTSSMVLDCECAGVSEPGWWRWTKTDFGLLGERYVTDETPLDVVGPRPETARGIVDIPSSLNLDCVAAFLPEYMVDTE